MLGFFARWISVALVERHERVLEKRATCEHTWRETTYYSAYPSRVCKWCKQQQHYHGDKETGEWRDL